MSSRTQALYPKDAPEPKHYFNDFVRVLSDKSIAVKVLPVFCAWEQPLIDGMESCDLVNAVNNAGGRAEFLSMDNVELAAGKLVSEAAESSRPVLIALIGAGDIDQLAKTLGGVVNA